MRDIVDVNLNQPAHALALRVDEKSPFQALELTQPDLPIAHGYVDGISHDCLRHGATTMFPALALANNTVLTHWKHRHHHNELLAFPTNIEANVADHLEVHLICGNYGTQWNVPATPLQARRPRLHRRFTPTDNT